MSAVLGFDTATAWLTVAVTSGGEVVREGQRGPGAQGLYRLDKLKPLRYRREDRMVAYRRAFNYGNAQAPAGAVSLTRARDPRSTRRSGAPMPPRRG